MSHFAFNTKKLTHIKTFGTSMLPLLRSGDVVYFKKCRLEKLLSDDIVVIYKGTTYISHRVIYKSKTYIITKGDNNNFTDGKIYPHQIIGKIYQIKRNKEIFPIESLSLIQNASYLQEIARIARLFNENGIDFVYLKGLPIYLYYTKKMPKRIYADCDILSSEHDFIKAKNLLLSQGYKQLKRNNVISRFLEPHLMEEDFFTLSNNYPIAIDLHRRPFSYIRKLDFPDSLYPKKLMDRFTDELLQTKRWVMINNITIPIPKSDYLIIFLSIHFFTHTMKMVHRLWLIKEVIKKDKRTSQSWDSLLELIQEYKIGFMVYPAFYFINKLYHRIILVSKIRLIKPKGPVNHIYKLRINLVFDERVDLSRVVNKILISWHFSPQLFYKRIRLFFSPSLFLLLLAYMQPLMMLFVIDMHKFRRKRVRK